MNDEEYREVDFEEYCQECRYKDYPEEEEPCNECLSESYNHESFKPINFKDVDPQGLSKKYKKEYEEADIRYIKALKRNFKTE